ncbi:hypothetical protein, partial [Leptospira borgpetersenii]|uniref:hypothetical protein n=1 Tax=Leptospira borgpetersenii TaxID=174 RepID=UPI001E39C32A
QECNVDEKDEAVIRLRNVADKEQDYEGHGVIGKDYDYILECYGYLKHKNGGPPSPCRTTRYGEWLVQDRENREIQKHFVGRLKPTKELMNTISLSHQFDLTMPGSYQFVVKRLRNLEFIASDPIVLR